MKTFIIVLFSLVALLLLYENVRERPKRVIKLTEIGFNFCDTSTYYFTNNSTEFCLTSVTGIFIIITSMLIYVIIGILFVPVTIWLAYKYDTN